MVEHRVDEESVATVVHVNQVLANRDAPLRVGKIGVEIGVCQRLIEVEGGCVLTDRVAPLREGTGISIGI